MFGYLILIWMFPNIVVPPNHPILIGFSIINHPFWDTLIFGNTYIDFNDENKPVCPPLPSEPTPNETASSPAARAAESCGLFRKPTKRSPVDGVRGG